MWEIGFVRAPVSAIVLSFAAAGLFSCEMHGPDQTTDKAIAAIFLPGAWERIGPLPGTFEISLQSTSGTFSRSYIPSCSGRPGTDSNFSFLVKRGSSKNLLINFMGGGGCWTDTNCLGPAKTITYNSEIASLSLAYTAAASPLIDAGILNHNNPENPFRNWNMIFIPYCTGDIHIGSADTTYADPQTGVSTVIHHRGFDNFLAVMNYVKKNFPESSVDRVFVTGQSAGGYGAVFNFPYIKEMFYSRQVDVLGDAAAGTLDASDTGATATAFQSKSSVQWNAGTSTPAWIPTVNGQYLTLSLGQFYNKVGVYYESGASIPAPGKSRYAQYSTAFDGNQRFFFNVMRLTLKNPPRSFTTTDDMWGRRDAFDAQRLGGNPAYEVDCNWNHQMRSLGTAAASGVYRKVIAPGTVHTISMSNSFFTQTIPTATGTVRLVDWYTSMLTGSGWTDAVCQHGKCAPPVTEQTGASALDCSAMAGQGFSTTGDGW